MAALFAALTAIGNIISIPIGAVPITLGNMFPILCGILLGARIGAVSQIIYILIGLIGIPVFSGFTGGIGSVISPGFGYLLGFILSAAVSALITKNMKNISFLKLLLVSILADFSIYIIGIPYLYFIMKSILLKNITFMYVMKIGVIVFIPGDLAKMVICAFLGSKLKPIMDKLNR